jgi:hypothetical protein
LGKEKEKQFVFLDFTFVVKLQMEPTGGFFCITVVSVKSSEDGSVERGTQGGVNCCVEGS